MSDYAGPAAALNADLWRALTGADLDPAPPGRFALQINSIEPPMSAPRKRRRLTGKRYRAARRHYARTMRAWHRGLIPGIAVTRVVHNVGVLGVEPVGQTAVSVHMGALPDPRGVRAVHKAAVTS